MLPDNLFRKKEHDPESLEGKILSIIGETKSKDMQLDELVGSMRYGDTYIHDIEQVIDMPSTYSAEQRYKLLKTNIKKAVSKKLVYGAGDFLTALWKISMEISTVNRKKSIDPKNKGAIKLKKELDILEKMTDKMFKAHESAIDEAKALEKFINKTF